MAPCIGPSNSERSFEAAMCGRTALFLRETGDVNVPTTRKAAAPAHSCPNAVAPPHAFEITPLCEARRPAGVACLPHSPLRERPSFHACLGSRSAAAHKVPWSASFCEVQISVRRSRVEHRGGFPTASVRRVLDWGGARCTTWRKRRAHAASTGAAAEPECAAYTRSSWSV